MGVRHRVKLCCLCVVVMVTTVTRTEELHSQPPPGADILVYNQQDLSNPLRTAECFNVLYIAFVVMMHAFMHHADPLGV